MERTIQTDNISIKEETTETIKNIKGIEEVIISEELSDYRLYGTLSMTETEDKRIASGDGDGNISIYSYDINEKTWKRDIHKEKAHYSRVNSLCALNGNRLLSGSEDCSIKVWSISDTELTVMKVLEEHTDLVCKVISLSNQRFASCSFDSTVRIWKDDNTYECISIL